MPRPPTTLFEDAIDVPQWLDADRETPFVERARRDREIGRRCPSGRLAAVRTWWRSVAPEHEPTLGRRLDRLRPLVTLGLTALGAIAGASVALAAFAYSGAQPVNVVRLLGLVVGTQLVLLALTLLLLAARALKLRRLQDLLATVNVGALALSIYRRLARTPPELAALFDWHGSRASAGRFAKWQLLYYSQVAAVSFNVAALATAIMLVTFTDLAFGWSTTLDADPAVVHRIVTAIAWPWHALAPSAVPSAALVEESQFFRLQGGAALTPGASRALGGWWPFTVAAIVAYGLLPRLALLVVAAARLRAATAALLLDDPRVTALLDRMSAPEIETAAAEHEAPPRDDGGVGAAQPHRTPAGNAHAVIWEGCLDAGAVRDYARTKLNFDVVAVTEAGGSRGLDADRGALEAIAAAEPRALVVLTPAWEPPLLELDDFLKAIRSRVGRDASIVVAPVPEAGRAVSEVEAATWVRAMRRIADPKLYVETGAA